MREIERRRVVLTLPTPEVGFRPVAHHKEVMADSMFSCHTDACLPFPLCWVA